MTRPARLMDVNKLGRLLMARGLDAVVAVSRPNVFYTSGVLLSMMQSIDKARWAVTVTPREGQPTLIRGLFEKDVTEEESWVSDVRFYKEYVVSPLSMLVEVLKDRGLADRMLGVEMDHLSAEWVKEMRALLPEATVVECDSIFMEATAVRTAAEIALMKRATDRMDRAFLETFSSAKVGDTEKELHDRMISSLLDLGAEEAVGNLLAGENALVLHRQMGDAKLQPGDIIRTDYLATFGGYYANLSRNAVAGDPTDEQRDTYHKLRACQRKTVEYMRAGVRGRDVFDYCMNAYKEAGYKDEKTLVGHNIAMQLHQRPMLVPTEEMELQPNMVMCIEPLLGWYHIQDEVLITEDEPILFSDLMDTEEMFVIE